MVLAFLPILLRGYGYSELRVGVVIGVFSVASMLLMVPTGIFSDYFSPKKIVVAGACCINAYFLGLLFSSDFSWLLLSVSIGGAGASALFIVLSSLYLKIMPRGRIGAHVAVYQVGSYLGYALGPLLGGTLVSLYSLKVLIGVAWLSSLGLIVLTLCLQDSTPIRFSFREYGTDMRRPQSLILILGIFVLATHFGVEQTSFTLLMKEKLQFATQYIGYMFAGIGLWMASLVPFMGRLMDYKQKRLVFLFLGLVVSAVFQIVTGTAESFVGLLAARLLHTTGDTAALLGIGVLTTLFFPEGRLGGSSGLLYVVRTAATFLGAIAAGFLNTRWGYGISFMANGFFVLAFTAVLAIFVRLYLPKGAQA